MKPQYIIREVAPIGPGAGPANIPHSSEQPAAPLAALGSGAGCVRPVKASEASPCGSVAASRQRQRCAYVTLFQLVGADRAVRVQVRFELGMSSRILSTGVE